MKLKETGFFIFLITLLVMGCDCPNDNEEYEPSCGACVPAGQTCDNGDAFIMPDMGVDATPGDPCAGEDPVYLSYFSAQYGFGSVEPTIFSAVVRSDGRGQLTAQGPLLEGVFPFLVYSKDNKYPEVLVHDVAVNPVFRITLSYNSQKRIDGAKIRMERLPKCEDILEAKELSKNQGEALLKWDQGTALCAAPNTQLSNQSNAQGLVTESQGFDGALKLQFDYSCNPVQDQRNN